MYIYTYIYIIYIYTMMYIYIYIIYIYTNRCYFIICRLSLQTLKISFESIFRLIPLHFFLIFPTLSNLMTFSPVKYDSNL